MLGRSRTAMTATQLVSPRRAQLQLGRINAAVRMPWLVPKARSPLTRASCTATAAPATRAARPSHSRPMHPVSAGWRAAVAAVPLRRTARLCCDGEAARRWPPWRGFAAASASPPPDAPAGLRSHASIDPTGEGTMREPRPKELSRRRTSPGRDQSDGGGSLAAADGGVDTPSSVDETAAAALNPATQDDTKAALKRVVMLAKPEVPALSFGVISMFATTGVSLAFPWVIGKILDSTGGGAAIAFTPWEAAAGLLVLFTGQAALIFMRTAVLTIAGERIAANLRKDLFSSLMSQDIAFFDAHRTGDIITRLSADVQLVSRLLTVNVPKVLRNGFMVVGGTAALFYSAPSLAALAMLCIPPVSILYRVFGSGVKKKQRAVQDALGETGSIAEERLSSVRIVRLFSQEETERQRYGGAIDSLLTRAKEVAMVSAALDGGVHLATNVALLSVLGYGGTLVMEGAMTAGTLTSFLLYCTYVGVNIAGLSSAYADFMKGAGASGRVFELMDTVPTIPLTGGDIPDEVKGEIEFKDVSFAYPMRPDVQVFDGLSLKVPAGSVVALVGGSGSGKSTAAALLKRLYDVDSGSITLDGRDVRELDATWLRRQMGSCSQETTLFSCSIADNVRYGMPEATDEQVEWACRTANAHTFVTAFPDGYDTLVGERGAQVSGGQRQRLAIARALLNDPPIVVLDEATSALDSESEHLVQEALERAMDGRTVLCIAHRLSSIAMADYVAVIQDGRVVEFGAYDELVSTPGGAFHGLVQRQLLQ